MFNLMKCQTFSIYSMQLKYNILSSLIILLSFTIINYLLVNFYNIYGNQMSLQRLLCQGNMFSSIGIKYLFRNKKNRTIYYVQQWIFSKCFTIYF